MKARKIFLFLFILFASLSLFSGNTYAANPTGTSNVGKYTSTYGGTMQQVLCNVLAFVTGTIGKTIASFIIIGVGVGFFTGKVSWGLLIGVTLGISAMFGAPAIVNAITGGDGVDTWCSGK